MLKQYGARCSGNSLRSWLMTPAFVPQRSSLFKLRTLCNESPQKLNVAKHVPVRWVISRSYATAAEVARTTKKSRTTVSVELPNEDGHTTQVEICPSYPHKPKAVENLLRSLPELLTDAAMPLSGIQSFSSRGWDLDESSDTIHRYAKLMSNGDIDSVFDEIRAASKDLNHDPHIHVEGKQLTISCTTHAPPGLSMKDVKLARKINEILERFNTEIPEPVDEAEILIQRQRGREHNMEAIRKAKLDCNCG